jgi:large conductance mechanosensitive channel
MKVLSELKEFAIRGNVTDMAVGIVIGAAFTAVIGSMVSDLFTPLLGLFGNFADLGNHFVVLTPGDPGPPYASLEAARAAGAATLNYGAFGAAVLNFLIVAVALFLFVRAVNRMRREQAPETVPAAAAERNCPFCRATIHPEATRCPSCTSMLE